MDTTIGCMIRPFRDLSFAQACAHIAAAGYTDLCASAQIVNAESTAQEARAARQTAEDAGVAPSMLMGRGNPGLPFSEALEDYHALIDNAVLFGAEWLLELGTSRDELKEEYISLLREAAPYAHQMGLKITMKPHGGITQTVDDLVEIYEAVDSPAFGISYDPGNIIYYTKGERRPETDVERVAPMVSTVVIKDCKLENGEPDVMITPGEGLVDFRAVLGGLIRNGFRGPCYVECVGGDTIDEIDANARYARQFVKELLAEID